jgi:MFS family permease
MPVRQSFVVEMVGREDVANAVALNSAVFNGTRIIGPAIAGLLIATVGLAPLFFFNAVSYLAVVAGLLLMRASELVRPAERADRAAQRALVVAQLGEGLSYVRHSAPDPAGDQHAGRRLDLRAQLPGAHPGPGTRRAAGEADLFGFLMALVVSARCSARCSIAFGQRPTLRLLLVGAAAVGVAMIGLGVSAVSCRSAWC